MLEIADLYELDNIQVVELGQIINVVYGFLKLEANKTATVILAYNGTKWYEVIGSQDYSLNDCNTQYKWWHISCHHLHIIFDKLNPFHCYSLEKNCVKGIRMYSFYARVA